MSAPCGRNPDCGAGCLGACGICCSHDPAACHCTKPPSPPSAREARCPDTIPEWIRPRRERPPEWS